uniref:Proteasome assembly chaperone 3 n=1 Tax=Fibrocapsa japonica TaxID=94617 RepID=A0A7S2V894_9STRA|mmetsp:Transcript_9330/g.14316  ORF Transcript_9330/g.14316 Transcript_9330/m.14316 type:complete len:137 (+) Transcript_9330:51-461(+)
MEQLNITGGGKTKHHMQSALVINGIKTEILVMYFADKIFIIVTQLKKIGTLVHVQPGNEATSVGASMGDRPLGIYDTSVLLGRRDDPLLLIYARQIMEKICSTLNKPLLLGIALKNEGRDTETFQEVLNELIKMMC